MESKNIKVGVTIGDMNGVGMEIIMKTFQDNRMLDRITPIVYGSTRLASYYRKALNINNFNFHKIKDASEAQDKKPNLIHLWEEELRINIGESTSTAGEYAFKSLEAATNDLAAGKIDVLITAPINKKNIQSDQFNFPGHTEYLTKLSNADDSLMLMVKDSLRVGTVTNHVQLKDVPSVLSSELIVSKINLLKATLEKDFKILSPKIAVLGLNPHAGEDGMLGEEEKDIIIPAIEQAESGGTLVFGPYPADGFFGSSTFKKFDGVLSMYHDQGLVPFKTIAGGTGVNYTAGLPIVRTSPDHGTAYDIAGKGVASTDSFRNALYLAVDIFENRKYYREVTENTLVTKSRK